MMTPYFVTTKFLASTALSMVPLLFSIFVVGCQPQAMIVNACITQVTAIAISYISLSFGNYLRSLDLISHQKSFNKTSYLQRILTSVAIDIALTACWYNISIFNQLWEVSDNYHILKYCVARDLDNNNNIRTMARLMFQVLPLISLTDKFIWAVGRTALDFMVLGANKYGFSWAKDIRSPFINVFNEKNEGRKSIIMRHIAENKRREEQKEEELTQVERRKQRNKERIEKDSTQIGPNNFSTDAHTKVDVNSDSALTEPSTEIESKGKKVKRRPDTASLNSHTSEFQSTTRKQQTIRTNPTLIVQGYICYDLPSSSPGKNFGVMNPHRLNMNKLPPKFTTCLEMGRIGPDTDIRIIGRTSELRPRGDDRVIGGVYTGIDGPATMLPLAQAMEFYDDLKEASDGKNPQAIFYDKYVSTHKKLKKALRLR